MEINRLRSIIKEAVNAYDLKEIEATAENAAMEAKLEAYDKAIKQCEAKIDIAESLEEMKDLVEPARLNELKKHLKNLQKSKEKLEKVKAKKNKEVVTDEPMDESYVEEDAMKGMNKAIVPEMEDTMEEEALNESFLKMQKLAGVITESQYNQKIKLLNEEVTVGGTYTASMPTSSDRKERIDVKVKVLGKDRSNEDKFIVTPLEDKDYINPVSNQQNRFEKGKHYGVEAEFIK